MKLAPQLPQWLICFVILLPSLISPSSSLANEKNKTVEPQPLQAIFVADHADRWKIADNRLECVTRDAKSKMSKVSLSAHRLKPGTGHFTMSVVAGIDTTNPASEDAAIGWMLGDGIFAGVDGAGRAFIRDANKPNADRGIQVGAATVGIAAHEVLKSVAIRILASTDSVDDKLFVVRISIHDPETNRLFSATTRTVPTTRLTDGISLVSHRGSTKQEMRAWFHDWEAIGSKLSQPLNKTDLPELLPTGDK